MCPGDAPRHGSGRLEPLQLGRRPAVVHRPGAPSEAVGDGRQITRGAGLPEPRGHAVDDGECAAPTPQGPRDAGITGVHPHMFRRTVATVINDQASVNLAAELLGHTDPKVTIEHYIRRNEHVNPLTAELLDAAFAADGQDEEGERWSLTLP